MTTKPAGTIPPITERLRSGVPLLLDGAMGTELQRRGVDTSMPLWSARALLDAPQLVRAIHVEYLAAGAEVLTTNTFRTNVRAMRAAGIAERARELTQLAVRLAREAIEAAATGPAWVAGSIAPVEDCYSPWLVPGDAVLRDEHAALAGWLAEAGVDLILIETMNTVREARAALEAARATGLPAFASVVCGADGRLLSGESIREAIEALAPLGPLALLVNCVPPRDIGRPLAELAAASPVAFGAYGHLGMPESHCGWEFTGDDTPARYAAYAAEWLQQGATIVGGCCGTTPAHIAAIRHLGYERNT